MRSAVRHKMHFQLLQQLNLSIQHKCNVKMPQKFYFSHTSRLTEEDTKSMLKDLEWTDLYKVNKKGQIVILKSLS